MERELPKFCESCGSKLVWGIGEFIGYDAKTGKQKLYFRLVCPVPRFWKFLHDDPCIRGYHYKRYFSKVETI